MTSIRLVTYNVQRFSGWRGAGCTLARICDQLQSLEPRPHMIALQEVSLFGRSDDPLETMAKRLGMPHWRFFGHVRGKYGNAVLSSLPFAVHKEVHLRGGSEIVVPPGGQSISGDTSAQEERHRIARGLLVVDVDVGAALRVRVGVTHIDHISIEQRRTQLGHVAECLKEEDRGHEATVLLGDLNALTRGDYSAEEWDALERRARNKGWAPPEHGADLALLVDDGFRDAFCLAGGGRLDKSRAWKTASTALPLYRIDYCFVRPERGARVVVEACRVLTEMQESDHHPILVDLRLEAERGGGWKAKGGRARL